LLLCICFIVDSVVEATENGVCDFLVEGQHWITVVDVRLKKIIMISILSLFGVGVLYAGGAKEADPIYEAIGLVEQKQYDKAIIILSQVIDKKGERMDEAEALLRKIRAIKGDYNSLSEQLVDVFTNEPDNYVKALDIINRMFALSTGNDKNRAKLEIYRRVAKLQYDRSQKNKLMARALARIKLKDYQGAIDIYESGFELQRPDFEAGGQSEEFKTSVKSMVSRIVAADVAARLQDPIILQALAAWSRTSGDQSLDANAYLQGFRTSLQPFRKVWDNYENFKALSDLSVEQRAQAEKLLPKDDTNEYLSMLREFMNGSPQKPGQEGIENAYAFRVRDSVQAWSLPVLERIKRLRTELTSTLESGSTVQSAAIIEKLKTWYPVWYEVGWSVSGLPVPRSWDTESWNQVYAPLFDDLATAWIDEKNDQSLASYLSLWNKRPLLPEGPNANNLSAWLSVYSTTMDMYHQTTSDYEQWINNRLIPKKSIQAVTEATKLDSILVAWRDKVRNDLVASAMKSVQTMGNLQYGSALDTYNLSKTEIDKSLIVIRGQDSTGNALIKRYPDQALPVLLEQDSKLRKELVNLQELITRNEAVSQELSKDTTILHTTSDAIRLTANINDLLNHDATVLAEARANIQKSNEFTAQADSLISVLRADINRLDSKAADDTFKAISTNYFNALELQENQALRDRSDKTVAELSGQIIQLKTTIAINQVNQLLGNADKLFNTEKYEEALGLINDAQEKWDSVRAGETNDDIERHRQRTIAAISLSRERAFTEADPAFNTLANYLNLARLDIENGRALLANGKKSDANEKFDRASKNLDNILQLKPNNFDARYYKLVILKSQNDDPATFRSLFDKRFKEALANENNANKTGTISDLQALDKILPGYPGIAANIFRIRVELGLEPNPADAARRNQAASLVVRGRALAASNDPGDLSNARNILNQAINLNQQNDEARQLLTTVQLKMGVAVRGAISSRDEQLFRRAQRLYNDGSFAQADQLVLELWNNRSNQGYPPLRQLKTLVDKEMGR